MQMSKEELRTRIEAEIISGKEPKDLVDKYDVPYVTMLGWKKKILAEKPAVDISDMSRQTMATLDVIKEVAKSEAPKVAATIDKIVDGVIGLKELEPEFQTALHRAVAIAHEYLELKDEDGKTALSIKEWQMITTTLANTYGTLFNKSGTVVNVAQTNVNAATENLAFFKASQKPV